MKLIKIRQISLSKNSIVWLVYDKSKGKKYALIKLLKYKDMDSLRKIKNIQNENLMNIHKLLVIDNFIYILAEYIEWMSLKDFMRLKRTITIENVTKLIISIVNCIKSMEVVGLLHGDLKPENILINHSCNEYKLIDYSSVIKIGCHYSIISTTLKYLSPNVLIDSKYTLRDELYSLTLMIDLLLDYVLNKNN